MFFKFVAIVFCFTLYVLPITETSKGPKKIFELMKIWVVDCSSYWEFFFFVFLGGVGGIWLRKLIT